jgi:hypothetical protein
MLRPQRDSKARTGERTATLRNDPQRSVAHQGVASLRNVAGRDALDESLDDSPSAGHLAPEKLAGVVETALAEALRLAAEAKRWAIVAQLADELAARQQTRDGTRQASAARVASQCPEGARASSLARRAR